MNCQEANEILDHLPIDQIETRRTAQVDAHLATCVDCARVWRAQSIFATLPDMPLPARFQAQCRRVVAVRFADGVSTGVRNPRQVLLWGSLAAMAAAAAATFLMFGPAVHSDPAHTSPLQGSSSPLTAEVALEAQAPAAPAAAQANGAGVAAIKVVAPPRVSVRVVLADPPSAEHPLFQAITSDPAFREALMSLRAALVTELRNIPDLAVLEEDPDRITAPFKHYRLRLSPVLMLGLNGRPIRKQDSYEMMLMVQELDSSGNFVDRRVPLRGFAVAPRSNCTSPDASSRMACDAATTAASVVRELREQVLPADRSVTQPLQAKFGDFSIAPDQRFNFFVDLFKEQAKAGDLSLLSDPGVVSAAVELSQLTDAVHREQLWRAMRGVGNAALIEPLVLSLQQDPESARIAAVETLSADFERDERARAALTAAASSDPRPLVRALARRGLDGEEGWQRYVASSLNDAAAPPSQRVEALLYQLYPPDTIAGVSQGSPKNYWQMLEGLDESAVRSVAEVFPKAEQFRKWPGNNFLGNFVGKHGQNPAVVEMLLTVLEHDARASNRSVAGEGLARRHAGVPRVRNALVKAVRNDPDASVREYIGGILETDYIKKAMEAATP